MKGHAPQQELSTNEKYHKESSAHSLTSSSPFTKCLTQCRIRPASSKSRAEHVLSQTQTFQIWSQPTKIASALPDLTVYDNWKRGRLRWTKIHEVQTRNKYQFEYDESGKSPMNTWLPFWRCMVEEIKIWWNTNPGDASTAGTRKAQLYLHLVKCILMTQPFVAVKNESFKIRDSFF